MDNMILIQSATVGAGGINNITFSAIPQTYTDLVVKVSTKCSFDWLLCEFNGSGGTAYDQVNLRGDGTNPAAGTQNNKPAAYATITGQNVTANVFGNAELYIPNYTGSAYKCISGDGVSEANQTAAYAYLTTSVWENTGAINQIKLTKSDAGNFDEYSTAYLYGISNITAGTGGAKATGGYVTEDDTYFYHTFLSSGVFTPTQSLTCDYLVIAGGGGGGTQAAPNTGGGAGGGAGGLRSTVGTTGGGGSLESPISVTAQAYAITVGAGGAGATSLGVGATGSNSVFSTITSSGGGGGGGAYGESGVGGGSGGGAGQATQTPGAGTANQGYAGGNNGGNNTNNDCASGGGGAGGVGGSASKVTSALNDPANSSQGKGGDGGAGVAISAIAVPTLTGVGNYYAGGGGGGNYSAGGVVAIGGSGVGGTGGGTTGGLTAGSGVTNTGSGGGGGGGRAGQNYNGGSGGSGLVVIRYAK